MKVIGEGSVTRLEKKPPSKCRKWRLRVQTDQGEKPRRFSGTHSQAKEALKEFIAELETPVSELTFAQYAERWRKRRVLSGDYEADTIEKERQQIKLLNREFGDVLLRDIDKPRAEDGLLAIKNGNNPSGRVLSGTYMNQAHARMKAIMESAADDNLIPRNPLHKVKAPKLDTEKRRALSRETLARFVCAMDSLPLDSHTVAARLAVLQGLRRGELVYTPWGDVDDTYLHVRDAVSECTGRPKGKPKSASGVRDVPLAEYTADVLARWKPVQAAMLRSLGLEQTDETPICCSAIGGYMHPQNLDRWWRNTRAEFGLDDVKLHELRHTYLTLLGATGSPGIVIKSLAGWASLEMADTYVHEDTRANEEAVRRLDNVIKVEIGRIDDAMEA
ncbi:tyrosine-type recombinase/integrase [Gordonibacter massiliensis (ex Traore et al. 2017)]|uniref:tyrosine-type recombinase/integrase n=1 Tax=Gordonibacter massiliensis (ex Traore et al. 2017) TaxID=1841863 RepID=UPI001C8C9E0C|nr:site-specific integrase [Gordonibacter massiliensis (ex Traore et al. 2017)]MBX9035079.1 tyrosine-type recombinase/integrase [Gordonibacter massiliensis (ex Traore et al. 2017)]